MDAVVTTIYIQSKKFFSIRLEIPSFGGIHTALDYYTGQIRNANFYHLEMTKRYSAEYPDPDGKENTIKKMKRSIRVLINTAQQQGKQINIQRSNFVALGFDSEAITNLITTFTSFHAIFNNLLVKHFQIHQGELVEKNNGRYS